MEGGEASPESMNFMQRCATMHDLHIEFSHKRSALNILIDGGNSEKQINLQKWTQKVLLKKVITTLLALKSFALYLCKDLFFSFFYAKPFSLKHHASSMTSYLLRSSTNVPNGGNMLRSLHELICGGFLSCPCMFFTVHVLTHLFSRQRQYLA